MADQAPPSDYAIVDAMRRFGGSFARALAVAAVAADPDNFARIKTTWPELWLEYGEAAQRLAARGDGPR